MINMQLQHEHLARLRCVLRSATARRVDAPDQVVMFAVPAIVSDFYRRVPARKASRRRLCRAGRGVGARRPGARRCGVSGR